MKPLNGISVLLLEDEFLIALDTEQILKELGAASVEIVATLEDAESCAAARRFDVALLDVNINGQMSFDLAQRLRERGIPVVFATGYDLPNRGRPQTDVGICVGKPFTTERLYEALRAALTA